jgi:hypothetical protein
MMLSGQKMNDRKQFFFCEGSEFNIINSARACQYGLALIQIGPNHQASEKNVIEAAPVSDSMEVLEEDGIDSVATPLFWHSQSVRSRAWLQ